MDKKEEGKAHGEMDELLKKVNKLNPLDLSADEDLSIAIMNLISIEEHLYFSGMKTNNEEYFKLLESIREMRVRLLKEIVKEGKGETWCISKHLLAAAMRLMEVGTKLMSRGKKPEAYKKFEDAFNLYSIFWGLNLNLGGKSDAPSKILDMGSDESKKGSFGSKMQEIVKKVIDCCREL
jgi:hypothetical protein